MQQKKVLLKRLRTDDLEGLKAVSFKALLKNNISV